MTYWTTKKIYCLSVLFAGITDYWEDLKNGFKKIMMEFISIFAISFNETTPYISNLYIFDNLRLQYSEVMFHVSCWKTELLDGLDLTASPSFLQIYIIYPLFHYL